MRTLIERLCSRECAGRAAGTKEGNAARAVVVQAFREAGLDPYEQRVEGCGGANVLAKVRGDVDRYVLVGAHFDHLGKIDDEVYWGADDNAAAVAVLVEVARTIAKDRDGRGVIVAAFDGEEPPHFLTGAMGSREFVRTNRDPIDFMVCMDLVGHRFGPEGVPEEVGASLFALGAERSVGTHALVSSLKRAEAGVIVRAADAGIIPPLSDYEAFWERRIPFLFLSAGRSRVYHTPEDTPDKLDYGKIEATARWLTRFVRASRTRDDSPFVDERLDRGTLDELSEVITALAALSPEAAAALEYVNRLRAACDRKGNLPEALRPDLCNVVAMLESRLQ
ncbi:MAG: M28 family metallopeptidase [Myxococcales bacterium]